MDDDQKINEKKLQKLLKEKELELKEKEKEIERLQKTKLGLYWDKEKEPEQVVLDCENNLPVLKRIKNKEIKSKTGEENILIEGDNFHALTCLNYTHKGKIDVIYIDPPYNTGAKDWKYNNQFVDSNDEYRHSKWLNMMEKRLRLAKNLLSESGVMICAIDKNEHNHLGLLLQKIFRNYEIHSINIVHNPRGIIGKNFSYIHENAYFVFPEGKKVIGRREIEEENIGWNNLRNWGTESLRKDAKNCFYGIVFDKERNKIVDFTDVCSDEFHPTINVAKDNNIIEIYPVDRNGIERKWRYARQNIEGIKNLLKIVNKNNVYDVQIGKNYGMYRTIWDDKKYDSNEYGSKLLKSIIDKDFPFPKSLYNVKDCINAVVHNKNSTILDFFAGSGTTGHAVLALNKEDGGNRKFILCTNNEINGMKKEFKEKYNLSNETFEKERKEKSKRFLDWEEKYGICSTVTYPRIEKVINGYPFQGKDKTELYRKEVKNYTQLKQIDIDEIEEIKATNKDKFDKVSTNFKDGILTVEGEKNITHKKEGLGGNLHYFKTDSIKKTKDWDRVKKNLTLKCTQMLCIKESIFYLEKEGVDYKIFSADKKDKFLCIYYNLIEESFKEFENEIKKLKNKKFIYIFSYNDTVEKSFFKRVQNFSVEPIPQQILNIYKELVKMTIPVKKSIIFIELSKAKVNIFDNKDKDNGARILRIVLEKIIQKICQNNHIELKNEHHKEKKLTTLNDELYKNEIFTQLQWNESRSFMIIGNKASHGEYEGYDLSKIKIFYKYCQELINSYIS